MKVKESKTPGGEPGAMGTRTGEGTARPAPSHYNRFLDVFDVMEITGLKKVSAYNLIRAMNRELKEKGYFVTSGKIPRKYFFERTYYGQ